MDPENSGLSTKMLLNNLDLQVTEVSTGKVYYGNGIQDDEYNNVSISILLYLFVSFVCFKLNYRFSSIYL